MIHRPTGLRHDRHRHRSCWSYAASDVVVTAGWRRRCCVAELRREYLDNGRERLLAKQLAEPLGSIATGISHKPFAC
jgi:hypothetical protein